MLIEAMKLALEALDMMIVPRSFQAQVRIKEIYETIEAELTKQEQGEPVGRIVQEFYEDGTPKPCNSIEWVGRNAEDDFPIGTKLYTTPQQRKPMMLEKFREMEALLDNSNAPQHKTITDDELKIIMETTMPVIDWKTRYGVELNNGERNKWMLEWFIAFARAIEAAHGIKE